jgi:DNA repair exonuclease SbcCD ATPase subunit
VAEGELERLRSEKEQYDLNVVAWIQAEAELERLREERDKADAVIVYQHTELERLRKSDEIQLLELERLREERNNCVSLAWHNEVVERHRASDEALRQNDLMPLLELKDAELERLRKELDAAQTALEGSEWALDMMRAIRPYASDAEKTVIWTKDWHALRAALGEKP